MGFFLPDKRKNLIFWSRTTHKLPCCPQMKDTIMAGSPLNYIRFCARDRKIVTHLEAYPDLMLYPANKKKLVPQKPLQGCRRPMGKSPTSNHTKNYTPPDRPASANEVQQPTEPNIVISKEERQNNEPELDSDEFNNDFFLLNQLQVEVDIRGIIEILATNNSNPNAYSSLI